MDTESNIIKKSVEIGGNILELEVGRFAGQTNAAVVGRYGDSMILVTVVSGAERPDLGYFPLSVEYQEKLYAGGRIKGSRWVKREGRPTDEAVLNARLVDRSIRPLFPKHFKSETQVIITVLSVDAENDPDILALNTASAALAISDLPWEGPIGAVRVGFISKDKQDAEKSIDQEKNGNTQGNFLVNPAYIGREYSDLDLVVSSTSKAIVMVEAGANEIPEETMLQAFTVAQTESQKVIEVIRELVEAVGKQKQIIARKEINQKLITEVNKQSAKLMKKIAADTQFSPTDFNLESLVESVIMENPDFSRSEVKEEAFELLKKNTREKTLKTKKRIDGRDYDQIRPITIDTGLLPRTHGSAMFKRGDTQALTITTLAAPGLEQWIETMEGEGTKRYMHHYYMPPYSVGETGRLGWPSRREIGHGALAERALEPMIPLPENFPYTIRVVSEILSSNGSTSMASVCGSTLSLMDAGVPLKKPVSGIAMGLIAQLNADESISKYAVLSDIQGIEDHVGDMDFKVTGTKDGITAMQMDVKIKGIPPQLMEEALEKAKKGRLFILDKMVSVLPAPRAQLSRFAPKVEVVKISQDQIGDVIGPGGKVIRQIMRETEANIEVDDDGSVTISGSDAQSLKKAVDWVKNITKKVAAGEEYEGTVKRIEPFGAFIEILPGKDGLLHVSKMSSEYVSNPKDIVSLGDTLKVKVDEIDDLGRINLIIPGIEKKPRPQNNQGYSRSNRNHKDSKPYRR